LSGVKGWVYPMKRIWISLIAAGMLTMAAISPAAGQNIFSVPLDSVDDSGVTGGASIRGVDEGVEITVFISAGDEGGVHPVNIYEGTCAELGEVSEELENIEEGQSVTTIDSTLGDIMTGEYAIAVGASEDDAETHVMCGNIPAVEGLAPDEDDDAVDEDDTATDDDEDAATDDEDDAATDDEDDAVTDDEDDAVTDDEDDAVTDDEDDAVTDDDDDAVTDDDDEMAEEEDDAAMEEDDSDDDTEDIVPATGGVGMNAEAAVALMTVLSGAALGGGLLLRRRVSRA
jgi:hypothetical protein